MIPAVSEAHHDAHVHIVKECALPRGEVAGDGIHRARENVHAPPLYRSVEPVDERVGNGLAHHTTTPPHCHGRQQCQQSCIEFYTGTGTGQ